MGARSGVGGELIEATSTIMQIPMNERQYRRVRQTRMWGRIIRVSTHDRGKISAYKHHVPRARTRGGSAVAMMGQARHVDLTTQFPMHQAWGFGASPLYKKRERNALRGRANRVREAGCNTVDGRAKLIGLGSGLGSAPVRGQRIQSDSESEESTKSGRQSSRVTSAPQSTCGWAVPAWAHRNRKDRKIV